MAGIYTHIPFCKQTCSYCNFHFSTSLKLKQQLLNALAMEIELSSGYLPNKNIDSIYLGGGTPSLLSETELNTIFDHLARHYSWNEEAEITIEANPDDLSDAHLKSLSNSPINRLSIGIQSFHEQELRFMNRAHSSAEASACIQKALDHGFENLSADLIFGLPGSTLESWNSNLETATAFQIDHLSCYSLTVEEKTALAHRVKTDQVAMPEQENAAAQFLHTIKFLEEVGFEHYEISNYAKPGKRAQHNSSYWSGELYLGLGPSAHSFNGKARRWNVANNPQYIKEIGGNQIPYEEETLSAVDCANEVIMTSLRTMEGLDVEAFEMRFSKNWVAKILENAQIFLNEQQIKLVNNRLFLTNKGKLIADRIAASMFV